MNVSNSSLFQRSILFKWWTALKVLKNFYYVLESHIKFERVMMSKVLLSFKPFRKSLKDSSVSIGD